MASTINTRTKSREERHLLNKAAQKASARTYKISKSLDLPVQVIKDSQIVERVSGGSDTPVKKIPRIKSKLDLKKGTVLCLKQKD